MDLSEYEQRRIVDDEHALEAADHRRQRQSERIREHARASVKDLPPLPDHVLDKVVQLLSVRTPPHQLMRWRLRLYCGHIVERTAHASHKTIHAAFTGGRKCEECGMDPSTIVAAQAMGLVERPELPVGGGKTGGDLAVAVQARRRHVSIPRFGSGSNSAPDATCPTMASMYPDD